MSNSKTVDVDHLSETFKALSNPNRLRIFLRLVSYCAPEASCSTEGDEISCAGEIGKDLGIAPSTVSHHLKELRVAGLIRMKRRGKMVECRVDLQTLREISDVLLNKLFSPQVKT